MTPGPNKTPLRSESHTGATLSWTCFMGGAKGLVPKFVCLYKIPGMYKTIYYLHNYKT